MKRTLRQILAFALVLCMLVAVLPFAAFAEEASADANAITFDFTGAVTGDPVDLIKNYEIGTNWQYYYATKGTLMVYPDYVEYAPTIKDDAMNEAAITGQLPNRFWFVFKLSGIEAGMYTMDFSMVAQEAATALNANVYIIPAAGAPSNNSGLTNKIANGEIIGTLKSSNDSGAIKSVNISGDENKEYLLMIDCQLNDEGQIRDTKIQLKTLTLTKMQAATPPATTAPTLPNFNDNTTEPADNGGFPVVAVVIAAVAAVAVVAVVVVVSKKKKNVAE